ncbi:MAG: anti-sigma factor [Acidobacteria bacterium]|nr:anti-sigma factor [Acidobacteriota bacterium]MDA1236112.1 anti-sigma factor [Acidobacteriota bacterium]
MNDQERLLGLFLEYELGTLEGEERTELESLLRQGDGAARAALSEARATVAQIGLTADSATPSSRVKEGLIAQVAEESRSAGPAPVIESKRFGQHAALAYAIAAGLLLFAFLEWQQVRELRTAVAELQDRTAELSDERDQLAENSERFERILAIISGPETKAVALEAPDSPAMHAYWNEQYGLMLAGDNLPVLAPGRTLQLWVIPKQGNPVSVDVFQPTPAGRALLLSQPGIALQDANLLAITDEPAGGSPQPTTTPIWVGPIT